MLTNWDATRIAGQPSAVAVADVAALHCVQMLTRAWATELVALCCTADVRLIALQPGPSGWTRTGEYLVVKHHACPIVVTDARIWAAEAVVTHSFPCQDTVVARRGVLPNHRV
eukprot:COSAG06_NODE_18273_length_895_cov_1.285176_1_plen_112_part_01